jgi:hypothetical protein
VVPKLPRAVIVRGNPRWADHAAESERFYDDLAQVARDSGYDVSFDPGAAYTTPDPTAQAWIGYSRGADRLRFAPPGVRAIPVGSDREGAINNPEDTEMRPGHAPLKAHYVLTDEMRRALVERLSGAMGKEAAMPFVSQAQEGWMWANKPEMAKKWQAHTPKGKKLPKRVKQADALSDIMGQARGMVTRPGVPNRTGEVKPGSMRTLEAPTDLGRSLMGIPKPTGPGFKTLEQPTELGRMLTGQKAPEGPVMQNLGGQLPYLKVVPNDGNGQGTARISPPPAQSVSTPMPAPAPPPTPPSPPLQTSMPGSSWLGGMGQNAANLAMAPFGGGSAGFPSAPPPAPAPASALPGGDDLIDPDKRVTEPMTPPPAPPTSPPGINGAGMASIYAPPTPYGPTSSPYAPTSAAEAFPQQTSAPPSAPLPPSPPPLPMAAPPPSMGVPQRIAAGRTAPGTYSVGSQPNHETAMTAAKQLRDAIRRKNSAATVDSGGYQQEVDAASANLRSITGGGRPNGGRAVMPSTPSERALGHTYAGNAITPDQSKRDANAYNVSPQPGLPSRGLAKPPATAVKAPVSSTTASATTAVSAPRPAAAPKAASAAYDPPSFPLIKPSFAE